MNTQLSHAEAQARTQYPQRSLTPEQRFVQRRRTVAFLALCMAFQMTSFVIILPLFARRFGQLGAGVEALGTSSLAYALASTLAAPFMGALADRLGRRLLVLASLAAYALAFVGYLFASSVLAFVVLRFLAGAFTAGLVPAVISTVADLAPTNRRAQWIGIVNGGASVGWIAGPILGGVLYDQWGYNVALTISIILAIVALLTAFLTVPETRGQPGARAGQTRRRDTFRVGEMQASGGGIRDTLPRSLITFVALLGTGFAVMFAWAFIEPRFMFYAYDSLAWTSSMLGLVMSTYGIAMLAGEFGLGQLSDRLGRKPVIVVGLVLFAAQFMGLAFAQNYAVIAVAFVIAGLGNALFDPALSAAILDIAPAEHQARALGLKSTASSLGNILGPALVVLATPHLTAQGIFLAATGIVGLSVVLSLLARSAPFPAADHAAL